LLLSIITPSFRASNWLKLCIASVADQKMDHEHIVQDSCSDDGTQEWLPRDPRVEAFVEKDRGMYDAVNRGFQRSTGEVVSYLNADEQYLPGTLERVARYFERHPNVDMLFGDVVMVDENGDYLSHRKMQTPLLYHTWTCHLSTLSCGMFFRRRLIAGEKQVFDPALRDAGDADWMMRLLRKGTTMAALGEFTSVFGCTGSNMSAGANARRENQELRETAPVWAQKARPLIILHHRLRRWVGGMYSQDPFSYDIFTRQSPEARKRIEVRHPRFRAKVATF
jgi:glycosyltransferase involved in cell wall biosynthesis